MSKPIFLFVPGAWNTPEYYHPLIQRLALSGYASSTVSLPSVNCNPGIYDFSEDVTAIREAITALIEEMGKDVVLVTHSYSGHPGQEAVRGLGKQEREEKGLQGGVVRLVFIMALMAPEGFSTTERPSTEAFRDWMKCDTENGIVRVEKADAKAIFFHDLPDDKADEWASRQGTQSLGVYWSQSTYAGWRYIPTTYIMCSDDRAFTVPYAEYLMGLCKDTEPCLLDSVETIDAGHFPMLSKPSEMADILLKVLGGTS